MKSSVDDSQKHLYPITMGQGIEVQIINATPYRWTLDGHWNGRGDHKPMVHWEFPYVPTVEICEMFQDRFDRFAHACRFHS